jgi:hypothetical protein
VTAGKAIQPSVGMVSCSADSLCEGSFVRAARENRAARAARERRNDCADFFGMP